MGKKTLTNIPKLLYSRRKGGISAAPERKWWGINDSYIFISGYCSSANYPARRKQSTSAHRFSRDTPNLFPACPYQYQSLRCFHDYFTTTVPNSSQSGTSSVVRIPLVTAKQHFGVSRSRGNRPHNDDWHQAGVLDLPSTAAILSGGDYNKPGSNCQRALDIPSPAIFYFGVFDGHGGDQCSAFLRDKLHEYIEETVKAFHTVPPSVKISRPSLSLFGSRGEGEAVDRTLDEAAPASENRKRLQQALVNEWKDIVGGYFRRFKPDFGGGMPGELGDGSLESVLTYAFLRADLDFITERMGKAGEAITTIPKAKPKPTSFKGGSTASVALIYSPTFPAPFWDPLAKSTLITAHIGDTRILLSNTNTGLAVPVTSTHHPSAPTESRRLRRYAAAFIQDSFGEERFGTLANTRSFGDVSQKRLGVTAEPEVSRRDLVGKEWAFMILCSDGVGGILSDQEIVDIVKEASTPEQGAKAVVTFAEEVGGSKGNQDGGVDNATAMVVRLGGWEDRSKGGEGSKGTKELRGWRVDDGGARRR